MAKAPAVFRKAKCAITGKGCFVAGTLVATINGGKAIETVEVGDKVLASDPETGETAYKEVLKTYTYVKDTLVYVTVDGETIETTKEHPFWVEGQGWTKAKFLESGDILRDKNGENLVIEDVDIVPLPENQYTLVYNLEVADFHTYYVADSYVLVHNLCYELKSNDIDLRGTGKNYREALDMAFEQTGYSKDQFLASKWARDYNGKSIPVEYVGPNSSMVDIDLPHSGFIENGTWNNGPDAPHIGWNVGRNNKKTGHIILDNVPTGRGYAYSDLEKQMKEIIKEKERRGLIG